LKSSEGFWYLPLTRADEERRVSIRALRSAQEALGRINLVTCPLASSLMYRQRAAPRALAGFFFNPFPKRRPALANAAASATSAGGHVEVRIFSNRTKVAN